MQMQIFLFFLKKTLTQGGESAIISVQAFLHDYTDRRYESTMASTFAFAYYYFYFFAFNKA